VTRPTNPHSHRARRQRKATPPVKQTADRQSSKRQAHREARRSTGAAIDAKRFSRKQLLGALTVAATIIGVLSSGTALFEWFGKKVNAVTPPPAVINAQLTPPMLINRHKPLGAFLSDTNQPTTGLTAYQLAEEGLEFLLRVHLQGEQGKSVLMKWTIIDSATDNPLTEPIYNQDAAVLRPRGPDQARQLPIWIPSPPRRGKFVLRVILLDQTHRPLVQADSKPFVVSGAPSG
jgi:hypothetical protein